MPSEVESSATLARCSAGWLVCSLLQLCAAVEGLVQLCAAVAGRFCRNVGVQKSPRKADGRRFAQESAAIPAR